MTDQEKDSIPAAVSFSCEVRVTRASPRWLVPILWLGSILCGTLSVGAFVDGVISGGAFGTYVAFNSIVMAMAAFICGISARQVRHEVSRISKITAVVGLDGLLVGSTFISYEDLDEVSHVRGRLRVISDRAGVHMLLLMDDGASKLIAAINERRRLHERLCAPTSVRRTDGYRKVRVAEVVPTLEEAVAEHDWSHPDVDLERALARPADVPGGEPR